MGCIFTELININAWLLGTGRMKKTLFSILFSLMICSAFAGHIAGGEMYYKYLGPGNAANTSRYEITLRLFRECNPVVVPGGPGVAQLPASVTIMIFPNTGSSATPVATVVAPRVTGQGFDPTSLSKSGTNPCLIGTVDVCYQIGNYSFTQELPNTAIGYVAMYQTCCRSTSVVNVIPVDLGNNSSGEGATFTCRIPGTNSLATGTNSSPVFALKDTTLVCQNTPFILDFGATDPDNDSLSYTFCDALNRGGTIHSADLNYIYPTGNVGYPNGYSGSQPLGPNVSINPITGIISGTAPASGYYVVTVCINEWRNGVLISSHRKDFALRVSDCSLVGASLKPSYITCDGFTMSFENESTSPGINSYLWNFGDQKATVPTSTNPTPTHTYADTGTYTLKLTVTSTGGCVDSATAPVRVYPGFVPNFNVQGTCYLNTYNFIDATTTAYGVVNSWRWDLGDLTSTADTSTRKDTAWKYNTPQSVQVRLITSNSKGCVDTIVKTVNILDKPIVNLAFRDTLICSIDTLRLNATVGNGSVTWVPDRTASIARMTGNNTPNPFVYPVDTTRYIVTVNDNGCINTDTVTVNVLDFIDVELGLDTSICRTDRFTLSPVSDALSYQWTASTGIPITGNTKYPTVQPLTSTMYYVTANLGYCQDRDSVFVLVAPYPQAVVRNDTIICFGDRVQLSGSIVGAGFAWSPTSSMINANTLFPIAGPSRTTQYVLTAIDTIGCDRPVSDTVTIIVTPPVNAYAGRDTFVVAGRPIQLSASGGSSYLWRPATGLDDPTTDAPIATLPATIDSIRYIARVTGAGGCFAEDDVIVRVFKTGPDLFVPSAFTPNGDGLNDIIRPVGVGIAQLQHFRIFNRWGQLIFSTVDIGKGWDGTYSGVKQPAGTYVYEAIGTDQLGNRIYRKGTLVLIR